VVDGIIRWVLLVVVKIDKKGRLVIPKEFREMFNIKESTHLIIEAEGQNTLKIRLISENEEDYTSDPLWNLIHNPVILSEEIEEQWSN